MLKLTDEQMKACYTSGYFRRYTFEFDGFTLDAETIHTESVTIKEAICEDAELKLGGCIASSCEFEVSETVTDNINLSGLRFRAYLHLYRASEEENSGDYDNPDKAIGEEIGIIPMGVFNVRSVEMIDDADYKRVVAYDDLYDWNVDVSEWYNSTMPTSIKHITYTDTSGKVIEQASGIPSGATRKTTTEVVGIPLGAIRCELLKHLMNLNGNFDSEKYNQATSKSYMNDDVIITKTLSSNSTGSIMGVDLLRYICELNGGFGKINRQGVFEVISLGASSGLYPENNVFPEDSKGTDENLYPEDNFVYLGGDAEEESPDFISTHYEEYNAQSISCVTFYTYRNDADEIVTDSTEDNSAKMVSYPADSTNPYVSSNPLTLQLSESELQQVAKNIYDSISAIVYRPNTTTLQGVPYYEPGDYYNVTKKISFESFVLSRTLTGIQGLRDEFSAQGLEVRENNESAGENIYASMAESMENEISDEEKQDEIEDTTENQTSTFEHDNDHFLSVVASSQYAWDDNKNRIDKYGFGEPTLDYKVRYKAVLPQYINRRFVVQDWGLPDINQLDDEEIANNCYCDDNTGWIYIPVEFPVVHSVFFKIFRVWKRLGRAQARIAENVFNYDASDVGMTYLDENTGKLYRLAGWNLSSDNPQFRWDFYKQLEKVTVQLETRIEQTSEEIALESSKRYAEDSYLSSRISVTADAITQEVSRAKGVENTLSSNISQTAHQISLTTTSGTKTAGITIKLVDEYGRTIDSDSGNITLTGLVAFEDLAQSGRTSINGANIQTGTIKLKEIASYEDEQVTLKSSAGVVIGNRNYGSAIDYGTITCGRIIKNTFGYGGVLAIGGSSDAVSIQGSSFMVMHDQRCYGNLTVDGKIGSIGTRDNTTTRAANVNIGTGSSGYLYRSTSSSRRYKNNICTTLTDELNPHKILDISVVRYKYNTDYLTDMLDPRYNKDVIGFIAEDIQDKYPVACEYGEYGLPEDWNARFIIPPMLSLIQEMYQKIEILENKIIELGGK